VKDEVSIKEVIKPEHLEILFRIVKERVVRQCELSELELKGLEYWNSFGIIIKNPEGRNPDDPIEKEIHYIITDKGEEYYLNYLNGFH
jgi:hypothetical protein